MKKSIVAIVLTIIVLSLSLSINTHAANYPDSFDPVFYANTYPDVVSVFGTTDPDVMYDHYIKYGYNEGRYQNATEQASAIPAIMLNITPIEGYSTYIDVNKTYQVVTYFENGEIKLQCPCVTGNERGHGTPVGTYSIKTKVPGKILTGPTWRCWVDRWMRFTDNSIGLHDAKWRSSFGGDIYKHNGSHGCVNLPHDAAVNLYDMISVGTTVIVH